MVERVVSRRPPPILPCRRAAAQHTRVDLLALDARHARCLALRGEGGQHHLAVELELLHGRGTGVSGAHGASHGHCFVGSTLAGGLLMPLFLFQIVAVVVVVVVMVAIVIVIVVVGVAVVVVVVVVIVVGTYC